MRKSTKLLVFFAVVSLMFIFAAFGVFADYTDDGTTMDATIASALEDAKAADVTITLNGTWTFSGDTVFKCTDGTIPTHTITVNGGTGATIVTGGYVPAFYGHFVFDGILFEGTDATTKNGLYAPEGCSIVIGPNCTGASPKRTNLAGDSITVNSGKWRVIAAQISNPNMVKITDPKITVQGTTYVNILCGLGYNQTNLDGKGDLKVYGSVTVYEYLVAGGYYSASSQLGGNLEIATTGDSSIVLVAAVVGSTNYTTRPAKLPKYTIDISSTATLTVDRGVFMGLTNGDNATNAYLDVEMRLGRGLKINGVSTALNNSEKQIYFGYFPGSNGATARQIHVSGSNKVTLDGMLCVSDGTKVFGGSWLQKANSDDNTDIEVIVTDVYNRADSSNVFRFNGTLYGGSAIYSENCTQSGTTTLRVLGNCRYESHGGSYLKGTNSKQTGDSKVYFGSNSAVRQLYDYFGTYAGSFIDSDTCDHEADSYLIIENTSEFGGNFFAGSQFGAGSHSDTAVGGRHIGDTYLEIKSANLRWSDSNGVLNVVALLSGGCSGYQTVAYDSDPDDGIVGGFSHVGNVNVVIKDEGGVTATDLSCRISLAGYSINVDGELNVSIEGGILRNFTKKTKGANDAVTTTTVYPTLLSLETPTTTWQNAVSISGDMKVYIKGGDFRCSLFNTHSLPYSTDYNPANGYSVIGGNAYWEFSGGTFNNNTFYTGSDCAKHDVYIKFVDDVDFSTANALYCANLPGSRHNANHPNQKRIVDLSQLTNTTSYGYFTKAWSSVSGGHPFGMKANSDGFTLVIPPFMDIDTASVTGATYSEGGNPLAGATINYTINTPIYHSGSYNSTEGYSTVTSYSGTYEDYIAWDSYASKDEYKNANNISLSASAMGKFTQSVDATFGTTVVPVAITNPNVATVTAAAQDEFDYVGVSIRATDSALRARAQVNETLRSRTLATDGYKVKSYGILVSKTATGDLTLGGAKTKAVVAYDGTTDVYFLDGSNYVFAAAIYNITSANYNTDIKFRPYVELEDANGDTLVVYPDMTGVSNFLDGSSILVSLKDAAIFVRDNDVAFYNKNKAALDAIIG